MRTAKPLIAAIAATLTFWCARAPLADDTEIFQATPTSGAAARPNILLIIDTSRSMILNSVTQPAEYDPLLSYAGPCNADRIYYTKGSGTVSCEGSGKTRYITSTQLVCKTAKDRIEGTGITGSALGTYVSAATVQWKAGTTKQWVALDASLTGPGNVVECAADAAIGHGAVDNDSKLPKNSSQWTTDPTQASNLTGVAATYTFSKGNYLNYLAEGGASGTVTLTRLEIVQSTARRFLDSLSNVNVGLMRFESRDVGDGTSQGGYVIHEFAPIETARDDLKTAITKLDAISFTPLSETMYEAFLYWKGEQPYYGNDSNSMSVPAARVSASGKYQSPLGASCGSNFNVLLTDGDPTGDVDADLLITALPNMQSAEATPVANTCSEDGGDGSELGQDKGDGRCLNDVVKYMYDQDLFDDPAIDQNATPPQFEPKNNVRTYTIGFGDGMSALGQTLLRSTAEFGNGKYYQASDGVALDAAFQDITRDVVDANVSFSAPTVAVNAFNRTQNLNDLFMTVFAPSDQFHWAGNLKKYRLMANGTIKDDSDPPKDAVDPKTGFFAKDTRSFWSGMDDGPDVTLGGTAHELPEPDSRNLYTDVKPGSALTSDDNKIVYKSGGNITAALTGLPATATEADLESHIDWIRGADVEDSDGDKDPDEPRFEMGDPLHARPVSVIYRGTATAPVGVIFAATNDGYLHAFDSASGEELWAYIPSELLPRMAELRENDVTAAKTYGLDGNIRAFKLDRDGDGIVEPAATNGDKVLLFFGMGRGGDSYYALDVTDEKTPKLLWKHSGSTGDNKLVGLGESWSTPVVTRVNISDRPAQNSDKLVVIFGGGYDNSQDNVGFHGDAIGNRLFIVDAITGEVLWHAGPATGLPGFDSTADFKHSKLTNSIPADLRVIDMSGDSFADRIYAADTGGRIWRFDIVNGNDAANLVRGGVLASLGMDVSSGVTSPADARKFYVAPDASLVTTASGVTFVNLAIGSGMRGSPKNTQVVDRLYSIRDYNPFTQLTAAQYTTMTGSPITDASLVDVTTTVTATIGVSATGWKIRLTSSGEKALAEARTFQGAVLFTTYDPEANQVVAGTGCSSTSGSNGLWIMKVLDAAPYIDRDGNATIEAADRRGDLAQQGLAPEAVIIFPSPDDPTNCQGAACSPAPVCLVGLENCGVSFTDAPIKTFWSQRDVD